MFDLQERAERMADYTLEHRGGTFDASTGEPVAPSSGYAVAVKNLGTGNGALLSRSYLVSRLCEALIHQLSVPYIGTWVETNRYGHDVCYVDRVVILPDRASALAVGAAFNERAVWDFSSSESVYVDRKAA